MCIYGVEPLTQRTGVTEGAKGTGEGGHSGRRAHEVGRGVEKNRGCRGRKGRGEEGVREGERDREEEGVKGRG